MNSDDKFPFEIQDVKPEENKMLLEYFKGEFDGFVQVGPKGYFFPQKYRQEAAKFYNMPIRPSDVFITCYPRSGSTLTQELVWMVANDLDYEKSNAVPLIKRFPYLENSITAHPKHVEKFRQENSYSEKNLKLLEFVCQPRIDFLAKIPSPRYIKSHFPLSLLPVTLLDTAKVVYLARDPRDVAISYYHLNRLFRTQGYIGDFKTYWNFFVQDLHYFAPYFEHVKEAWEQKDHPNMLFLFYEELSKNLPATVRRVAKFLGKEFSDEQIERLCDHLSIDNFKNNKSVNFDAVKELGILQTGEQGYIRRGKAGGWSDYFDEEMMKQAERWITDNLQDTDLRFPQ